MSELSMFKVNYDVSVPVTGLTKKIMICFIVKGDCITKRRNSGTP